MINESLENIIQQYHITDTDCILYGTNIPMPNLVIPTPFGTHIRFERSEYYFFHFDANGITIYPIDGKSYAKISWEEVTDFKVTHVSILGKMKIKTKDATYQFQLNRFVFGCSWIGKNTKFLEGNRYFYNP